MMKLFSVLGLAAVLTASITGVARADQLDRSGAYVAANIAAS